MKPLKGHALTGYDRNAIWRPGRGTWIDATVSCECGAWSSEGVNNLGAARQWHREHKAEVAGRAAIDRVTA